MSGINPFSATSTTTSNIKLITTTLTTTANTGVDTIDDKSN